MLSLAIENFSELEIDKREILRGGSSYMIDTLKELVEIHKEETICLIIGMDSFVNFKTWKQWDEFSKLVHMIILPRNGDQPSHKNLDTFKIADNIDQLTKLQYENDNSVNLNNLESAMSRLDDRSKDIIKQRYLLEDKVTLDELSKKYKISKERVRQIENQSLDLLKNNMLIA